MLSDLRFALRQLVKSPGYALVAVATLALGIGACAVMFSLLDAVLLRPLPFRDPERLVWIENNLRKDGLSGRTTRADVFAGWRENSRSFEALGAYFAFFDYERLTLTGAGEPVRLRGVGVSDNFLTVLGVPVLRGRNFTAEECTGTGPRAVVLGHGFWQRRFASDPSVVGRSLVLNGAPHTVVGVLPSTFDFDAVFSPGTDVDVLTPFPINDDTAKWGNTLFAVGRLRPGVTVAQAQEELTAVNEHLKETLRWTFGADVTPLGEALRGRFRRAFLVLAGAVACVLAIACVNLSNLLLARANARRQEYAVRAALGASRYQIVRQAIAESLVLAFAGALLGLPAAVAATYALAQLQTFGVPLLQDARIDGVALGVTIGLAVLAGLLCGVLPALALSRGDRAASLHAATHQRTAGRSAAAARGSLVVAEVALASVLLVGAGLLFRSFESLLRVSLGFEPQRAMAWRVDRGQPFATNAEATAYFDAAVLKVAEIPGVEAVALGDTLPLGRNRTWPAGVEGVQYALDEFPMAYPRVVDHHYLETMRIPLVAGRYLDARDDAAAPKVVVVNETLARRNWPDGQRGGPASSHHAPPRLLFGARSHARRARPLRRRCLLGRAAASGDRDPDGDRRPAPRGALSRDVGRAEARGGGDRRGPPRCPRPHSSSREPPLRRHRARPARLRGQRGAPPRGGRARLRAARAPRLAARPGGDAARGVGRQAAFRLAMSMTKR